MPAKLKSFNEQAFSLIELLIVISIIAIISALLFVSFTQLQKNSRDNQRKSDLQVIASMLQRYYSDNSSYPFETNEFYLGYTSSSCNDDGSQQLSAKLNTGALAANQTLGIICGPGGGKTYIKELPKDPIGNGNYQYCYETTGPTVNGHQPHGYVLYALMENPSNSNTSLVKCGFPGDVAIYNYKITSSD